MYLDKIADKMKMMVDHIVVRKDDEEAKFLKRINFFSEIVQLYHEAENQN